MGLETRGFLKFTKIPPARFLSDLENGLFKNIGIMLTFMPYLNPTINFNMLQHSYVIAVLHKSLYYLVGFQLTVRDLLLIL